MTELIPLSPFADFTNGWIRVVAAVNDYSSWNDSWKMTLPEITWTGTD